MNGTYTNKRALNEAHGRLLNWGRWLYYDPSAANLSYPRKCPFVFSPSSGPMVADLDAQHINEVVMSLCKSGSDWLELYAFILKVEYAERREQHMNTLAERAHDVSRRFCRPCAEETYRQYLIRAKHKVIERAGHIR